MERVKELHLRNIISRGLEQDASRDVTAIRYFLATVLLRHYLGTAWCDECVRPGQPDVPRASRLGRLFLRTDSIGSKEYYKHQERIERLAELLYNLQDVQGIAGRRRACRKGPSNRPTPNSNSCLVLLRCGIRVRFLNRSGVKGADYDFDAGEEATPVSCEVKCKLEETDLGENTIINALDTAKQTPATAPAIIGVKLRNPGSVNRHCGAGLNPRLRRSSAIPGGVVAVVVRWEEVFTHRKARGDPVQIPCVPE